MFSVGCPCLLLSQDVFGRARSGVILYYPFLVSSFERHPVSLQVCSVMPEAQTLVHQQILTSPTEPPSDNTGGSESLGHDRSLQDRSPFIPLLCWKGLC